MGVTVEHSALLSTTVIRLRKWGMARYAAL